FSNNCIYTHKILQVNYTLYDIHWCQDSMNPWSLANAMTLAQDADSLSSDSGRHPFLYAQILGIFHADIVHNVPTSSTQMTQMEFIWVSWYQLVNRSKGGFAAGHLHRVELVPKSDLKAFGFLDPDEVIRSVHLIPHLHMG
ncbi:hypothetical protein GLOTRDRAFT_24245, partial [Gloeophyllum trabeum ATCC 11539]